MPRGTPTAAILGLMVVSLSWQAGCFIEQYCQIDEDCTGLHESCDWQTGHCRVECNTDEDCWVNQAPVGKSCIEHRCEFPPERVPAPKFCLEVVNPASSYYGGDLCLADLKGKVVLIFFGLLA
jgi:hypothetical protein